MGQSIPHYMRLVALRNAGGDEVATKAQQEVEQQAQDSTSNGTTTSAVSSGASSASSNGAGNGSTDKQPAHLSWELNVDELGQLDYRAQTDAQKTLSKIKLAFALPWRRFKNKSILTCKLEGELSDQLKSRFAPGFSLPQLVDCLEKAAYDPRIEGICFEIGPLAAGWAKLEELRSYVRLFNKSGKFSVALMKLGGEKEYYLASAFQEVYVPPSASLRLNGFSVSGTFLRGLLDKVGVEPQVQRIGQYKSAGDQLLRRDMAQPQRTQLGEIVDDVYSGFLAAVAEARGKTQEEVAALLDQGVYDNRLLAEGGWVDGLRYEDEVIEDLKQRTGQTGKKDKLRRVGIRKYAACNRSTFGLHGKKVIAVLRASGAIIGGQSSTGGSVITPDGIIPKLRALAQDKRTAAVVLRVDSPGGDALASDLMWREIRVLSEKKPVIASMGDVAASGGYYMSMGCQKIVAQPLTITGSIGVVTGKLNLGELYNKIGYGKELVSRGRFSELLAADNRGFTPEEQALFEESAQFAYESFRDKAAASRGMTREAMQEVAQGRVWTGQRALAQGLVDVLGGLPTAIQVAKQAAGIPQDENVTVVELSRSQTSPLALLTGSASLTASALAALAAGEAPSAVFQRLLCLLALSSGTGPNGLT